MVSLVERGLAAQLRQLSSIARNANPPGVDIVPCLGKRYNTTVMQEAEQFVPLATENVAHAGVLLPASAHTRARYDARDVEFCIEQVFGPKFDESRFLHPDLRSISEENGSFPPHLLVAWNANELQHDIPHERCELGDIAQLNRNERQDVISVISTQTEKSINALQLLTGESPRVYGLFGRATDEEVSESGLGYGAPSIALGHLHVAVMEQNSDTRQDLQPTAQEKVKKVDPWNELILQTLGETAVSVVSAALEGTRTRVNLLSDEENISAGSNGLHITFEDNTDFATAFDTLVEIVGKYEQFYDCATQGYAEYQKTHDPSLLFIVAEQFGLGLQQTEQFVELVTHIQPTAAQLELWIDELKGTSNLNGLERLENMKMRYEHISERRNNSVGSVQDTLVNDKYKKSRNSQGIFHARASGAYEIEQEMIEGKIRVKGIKLYPKFTTNAGVPEEVTGNVLRRS